MRPDLWDNGLPRFTPLALFNYKTWSSLVIHVIGLWMECIGLFTSARGHDVLFGLPLFLWAQGTGLRSTPIFKPYQLPPSPCVRIAWARAVIVPASIAFPTCPFGLALIAAISRTLIMIFGFRARLFRFDDLFSFVSL